MNAMGPWFVHISCSSQYIVALLGGVAPGNRYSSLDSLRRWMDPCIMHFTEIGKLGDEE